MVRAGPGRAWLPGKPSTPLCVPGLNSWEWAGALQPGWGSAKLLMSSWEPSPGHWEHSPAPSTRPGRRLVAYVALRGQPQPSGHPRLNPACPAPALKQHPSRGADRCRTPGMPTIPPPQNIGPSQQLRISLKCFFLSFLHGVQGKTSPCQRIFPLYSQGQGVTKPKEGF